MGVFKKLGKRIEKSIDRYGDLVDYRMQKEIEAEEKKEGSARVVAIVSIVFGVLGILLICFVGLGFFPGLIAIILSGISFAIYPSSANRLAIIGMIEGVISVILSIAVFIIIMALASSK